MVSGLRRGELAALTWDNIDFEKNKISVTNSVCELKNKIFIKSTKTDASKRSMFIPDFMMKILREHKENFKIGWSEKFSAHFTPYQPNGTDIKTVKNRAGHTRIETTMSYTHPSEDLDRKAANIFEKFF